MDNNRQGEGGSGSAENKGESREAQKAQMTNISDISEQERKDIADQTGLKPDDIVDLQQTGALSGRDDAAGGSGDGMTSTSSNEGTDRL